MAKNKSPDGFSTLLQHKRTGHNQAAMMEMT